MSLPGNNASDQVKFIRKVCLLQFFKLLFSEHKRKIETAEDRMLL